MIREKLLTTCEPELWNKYLPSARSVFGSYGYAKISQTFRDYTPRLYIVESGENTISYPILLRSILNLDFKTDVQGKWDSTTPEFTGPIAFGNASAELPFWSLRDGAFQQEGIISEFAHLYPWRDYAASLSTGREYNREIVWIDTQLTTDELWRKHFENSCRKNINTAQRLGVRVFEGKSDADIREFHRIYTATMQRNHALPRYYYSVESFLAYRDELPDNSRFMMAEYKSQIIAATLYLHDDNDVFSYLGGADADFQHVRPTNLVIWDTIRWANSVGKKKLILGGGYKPNDGIFRFKSTFSPNHKSFQIYKRIHREQEYRLLDQRCRERYVLGSEAVGYFPSYRYVPEAPMS